MRGLAAAFNKYLDQRLRPSGPVPIAVGLSGGGDSVALLALTAAWARRHGRRVLALTVDHGLQAESAGWGRFAAELAVRLGAEHRVLPWLGEKPLQGLAAAARQARHALLATAVRDAGGSVLLLGHTADDRLEAAHMRAEGATLGELRPWSPSPAWPDGRWVMLLRPLLDVRRAALRAWLTAEGLPWIEDPANTDRRNARARARVVTAGWPHPPDAETVAPSTLLADAAVTADGRVIIARPQLAAADGARFLAVAIGCAAGGGGAVRPERVRSLLARLAGAATVTATLSGARVQADNDAVHVMREPGRGGLPLVQARAGQVWDGRFELTEARPGWTVAALHGRTAWLSQPERRALAGVPPAARGVLPALIGPDGGVTCPPLSGDPVLRPLVEDRLRAALGAVVREA